MATTAAEVIDRPAVVAVEHSHPWHSGALRDCWRLFVQPSRLFTELPIRNHSAFALLFLVVCQVGYALAVISTGVIDYEIDLRVQHALAQPNPDKEDDDQPGKTAEIVEAAEKQAIFLKHFTRVVLVLGGPLRLLLGIGILAGILFLIVAMRGGKPNYQILAAIVTFAWLVEIPRLAARVWLISQLQVSRVETSLAAFAAGRETGLGGYLLLRRFDPFDFWFWGLVGLGLVGTGQLSRRAGIVTVVLLGLTAAMFQCLVDVPELADIVVQTSSGA